MSNHIENRIVEMEFDNKQFEDGVQESLSTLDKLKKALNFKDAGKNLDDFAKATKQFDLNGIGEAIENVGKQFSTFRLLGIHALSNVVDAAMAAGKKIGTALMAPITQAKTGGWNRAMNIENAKFQLKGLGVVWEDIKKDIDYAVKDTAYGLDAAAKAAAQLTASGVAFGETFGATGNSPMAKALRGISGVAAMTNSSYEDISQIFTRIAGQGRVMATDLNSLAARGLNAAAILGQQLGATEADIREFVHDGKISFETFAKAMDDAFGQHAKDANQTFTGALANIKAALSRTGEPFARSIIENAIPVFNQIRLLINKINENLAPVANMFDAIAKMLSGLLESKIAGITEDISNNFTGLDNVSRALENTLTAVLRIIFAVSDAFKMVFPESGGIADFLNRAAEGAERFSEKLLLDNETLGRLRNTVALVLSVLKLVFSIIGKIMSIGRALFMNVGLPIINVLGRVILYVGDFIYKGVTLLSVFIKHLNIGEKIGKLFQAIGNLFVYLAQSASDTSTTFGKIVAGLKNFVGVLLILVGGPIVLLIKGIAHLVDGLSKAKNPIEFLKQEFVLLGQKIKGFIDYLKQIPILGKIVAGLEFVILGIGHAIQKTIAWFQDFISRLKQGQSFIDVLKAKFGELGDAFENMKQRIRDFINGHEGLKAALNIITTGFEKAKHAIDVFLTGIKERFAGLTAAKVILMSFAAMILICVWNINDLIRSFASLARKWSNGFFNIFKQTPTKFEKFITGLIGISAAIALIAGSFYLLKDIDTDKLKEITKALAILIGMVAGLSLLATVLVQLTGRFGGGDGFIGFATNMFALAAGVAVLILALKEMDMINMDHIWKKIAILGVISAGLMLVGVAMSRMAPKLTSGGLLMIMFATSILILVGALEKLSRLDLTGISENWKELTVIILAFGVFAAAASSVGIGSVIGLMAFLFILKTLLKNYDSIKSELARTKLGETLSDFATKLKEEFNKAVNKIKHAYNSLSQFDKIMLAIYGVLATGSIVLVLKTISSTAKSMRKMAFTTILFLGAIAGFMALFYAIADMASVIPLDSIKKAENLLMGLGGFILLLMAVCSLGSERSSGLDFAGKGKNAAKFGRSMNRSSMESNIVAIRKLLVSVAALLLAVAGFMYVISTISPDKMDQAAIALAAVMVFVAAIAVLSSFITKNAQIAGKSTGAFSSFMGIIMLIATLIGSFVVLMYYFESVNFSEDWPKLVASIVGLGVVIGAIILLVKTVSGFKGGFGFASIIGSLGLSVGLIGGVIVLMVRNIKENQLGHALKLTGILAGFMVVLMAFAVAIVKLTKNTEKIRFGMVRKSLNSLALIIGELIAAVAIFGGLAIAMQVLDIDTGRMIAQIGFLTLLVGLLVGAAYLIVKKTQEHHFTKAQSEYANASLRSIMSIFRTLMICIGVLAAIALVLQNVDAGRMAGQLITLTLILGSILLLALAVKKVNEKLGDTSPEMVGKLEITMSILLTMMTWITALFFALQQLDNPWKSLADIQALTLVIVELGVLVVACQKLSEYASGAATGMGFLSWMLGLFWLLVPIFFVIDKVGTSAARVLAMTQSLILVLFELTAIAGIIAGFSQKLEMGKMLKGVSAVAVMEALFWALVPVLLVINKVGVEASRALGITQSLVLVLLELAVIAGAVSFLLGNLNIKQILIGALALALLEVLFWALVPVLLVIDSLSSNASTLLKKTQILMLVLTELVAITALLLGPLIAAMALGGISAGMMLPLVAIFGILALIFEIIDDLHVDGLLKKSQIIVLVLVELVGIMSLAGTLIIAMALGGISAGMMLPILGVFAALVEIFGIIQKLSVNNLLKKSQIIVLVLVELVAIASLMGALIIALALSYVSSNAMAPLIEIFGRLAEIFQVISRINTDGVFNKAQEIVKVLMELVGIASLMGVLCVLLLLGWVGSVGLDPVVDIFEKLAKVFYNLQKIHVNGLGEKADEILICMLKLVGIAAVIGVLAPLALLASLGTPAILDMCEAMVLIAIALQKVQKMSPTKIEEILDSFAKVLLEIAGIGIIGLIGGPGLIMLAAGIELIGAACALVIGAISGFVAYIVKLANVTPQQIETLNNAIKAFFNSVGNGIIHLGKAFAQAFIELAKGVVQGANQMQGAEPAVDFICKSLKKLVAVGKDAVSVWIGLLALGKAVQWIGEGIQYLGKGIELLGNGIANLKNTTPQQIENMKTMMREFFDEAGRGIEDLAEHLKGALRDIGRGLSEFNDELSNSENVFSVVRTLLKDIVVSLVVLALVSPGLVILSIAISDAVEAFDALVDVFLKISKIDTDQINGIKNAIGGVCDAITSNKEGLDNVSSLLWNVIGMFAVVGVVATLASPGFAVLALAILGIAYAVQMVVDAFTQFTSSFTQLANMTDAQIANMKKVISEFFKSIIEGVRTLGDAILETVAKIITGVRNVWHGGTVALGAEAQASGQAVQTGFSSGLGDSSLFGAHFISNFASGMQSNFGLLEGICSAGAAIVKAYWGHTSPEKGGMKDDESWGGHFIDNFKKSFSEGLPSFEDILDGFTGTVKDKIGGMIDEAFPDGLDFANGLTAGLGAGYGDYANMVDKYMYGMGAMSHAIAELNSQIFQLEAIDPKTQKSYRIYGHLRNEMISSKKDYEDAKKALADYEKEWLNSPGRTSSSKKYLKRDSTYIELSNALTDATRKYDIQKKVIGELDNEYQLLNGSVSNFYNTVNGTGGGGGGGGRGGGLAGATQQLEEFSSKLKDVLEGQMDIFSKFEKKEAMSKDELLANMRSQIEGMTNWAKDMQALAAKGIDKGLYEKLAMMGPQGAEYVGAFAQMTSEELMEANTLWAQSLVLPGTVSQQVAASFAGIGTDIMNGWLNGVNVGQEALFNQLGIIATECHAIPENELGIHSPSTVLAEIGMYMMLGLRDGIEMYWIIPRDAMKFVCGQIIADTKKELDPKKFYNIGKDLLLGLADGLRDKDAIEKLTSRLRELADVLEGGERDAQESQSPSKRWARIGRDLILGLSEGMKNSIGEATGAADFVADETVNSMKQTIAGIAENLLNDDEFTPVITPVLDLTNVQSGAKQLNSMFTTNQALSAMTSINGVQNEQQLEQLNQSRLGTTFIQNNYSPKALNRMEIYRQTRNQFAQYREAMR